MDNIPGIFTVDLCGSQREIKVTFGLVERLERRILNRPLFDLLQEAASQRFYISDIATVIHEGLAENGDKRLSKDQVGQEIMERGVTTFAEVYVNIIVYALNGGVKSQSGAAPADDKKK